MTEQYHQCFTLRQPQIVNHYKRDWIKEFKLKTEEFTPKHLRKLREFFEEFSETCSQGDHHIGRTTLVQHHIDTGDARPIKQRAFIPTM